MLKLCRHVLPPRRQFMASSASKSDAHLRQRAADAVPWGAWPVRLRHHEAHSLFDRACNCSDDEHLGSDDEANYDSSENGPGSTEADGVLRYKPSKLGQWQQVQTSEVSCTNDQGTADHENSGKFEADSSATVSNTAQRTPVLALRAALRRAWHAEASHAAFVSDPAAAAAEDTYRPPPARG